MATMAELFGGFQRRRAGGFPPQAVPQEQAFQTPLNPAVFSPLSDGRQIGGFRQARVAPQAPQPPQVGSPEALSRLAARAQEQPAGPAAAIMGQLSKDQGVWFDNFSRDLTRRGGAESIKTPEEWDAFVASIPGAHAGIQEFIQTQIGRLEPKQVSLERERRRTVELTTRTQEEADVRLQERYKAAGIEGVVIEGRFTAKTALDPTAGMGNEAFQGIPDPAVKERIRDIILKGPGALGSDQNVLYKEVSEKYGMTIGSLYPPTEAPTTEAPPTRIVPTPEQASESRQLIAGLRERNQPGDAEKIRQLEERFERNILTTAGKTIATTAQGIQVVGREDEAIEAEEGIRRVIPKKDYTKYLRGGLPYTNPKQKGAEMMKVKGLTTQEKEEGWVLDQELVKKILQASGVTAAGKITEELINRMLELTQ